MLNFIKKINILGLYLMLFGLNAHASSIKPCGQGAIKTGVTYAVNGKGVFLLTSPKGAKIINQKATEFSNSVQYLAIDNSVTVIEDCHNDSWSLVRVTNPDWLRDTHIGWVKSNVLRNQKKDVAGKLIFTEDDFIWSKKILPYKTIIVSGVNKIARENNRCKEIDPSSAYISSTEGTSENPVFFVTCGSGSQAFNVFFSKNDLNKDVALSATTNIDKNLAITICRDYAKTKALRPNTFEFSAVNLAVNEHPNGRTTVRSSFTSKNGYNLDVENNIRCLLDSTGLIEANITNK